MLTPMQTPDTTYRYDAPLTVPSDRPSRRVQINGGTRRAGLHSCRLT
jgi:DNA gyrase inhibitor GyrI